MKGCSASGIIRLMQVLVKLFGEFREAAGRSSAPLELTAGSTVARALEELGRRMPQLQELVFDGGRLRDHIHVFVNGRNVATSGGLDEELSDGDTLTFFPPVGGG